VESLLSDPIAAEQMAERAFRNVHNLSWDRRASQILEFAKARLTEGNQQLRRLHMLRAARALVRG
jgi:hypothetical protein